MSLSPKDLKFMYIGVDIGGSHITAAQVDLQKGKIIGSSVTRSKLNPHDSAENILNIWVCAIKKASEGVQTFFVGIAMPGPFDYENGICLMQNVNKYEDLYGLNIKQIFSERLRIPTENICFRNDSEAFLEGEMLFGAGRNYKKAIGITIGTGLGTSIYEDHAAKDMAMGINHPMLTGVAEDYISTRWFVKRYKELTGETIEGAKFLVENFERDVFSRQVFAEFSENISLFIGEFTEKFLPEIIIIGGNIANASDFFFPAIEKSLAKNEAKITLVKSCLNEEAALMGAVGLWKEIATKV